MCKQWRLAEKQKRTEYEKLRYVIVTDVPNTHAVNAYWHVVREFARKVKKIQVYLTHIAAPAIRSSKILFFRRERKLNGMNCAIVRDR